MDNHRQKSNQIKQIVCFFVYHTLKKDICDIVKQQRLAKTKQHHQNKKYFCHPFAKKCLHKRHKCLIWIFHLQSPKQDDKPHFKGKQHQKHNPNFQFCIFIQQRRQHQNFVGQKQNKQQNADLPSRNRIISHHRCTYRHFCCLAKVAVCSYLQVAPSKAHLCCQTKQMAKMVQDMAHQNFPANLRM